MRKLALDDDILMQVEKPARYIGNEVNSVMKNKDDIDVRVAFAFPDVNTTCDFLAKNCTI